MISQLQKSFHSLFQGPQWEKSFSLLSLGKHHTKKQDPHPSPAPTYR